jgi:hypothetical protein
MSEYKFSCSHCEQHLQCDESLGGKQITCPACHHLIRIPPSPAQLAGADYSAESGRTWDTFVNRPSPPKPKPPAPALQTMAPPADVPPSEPALPTLGQRIAAWFTRRRAD